MEEKMNIKWKPLKDYEGLYTISNYGDVMSLKNRCGCGRNGIINTHPRLLKQRQSEEGYMTVVLIKNRKHKTAYVHRLVALTFIEKPENLNMVNHKDENKLNNCAWNLEWCDSKYNSNYGTKRQRLSIIYKHRPSRIPVLQYTVNDVFVDEYKSIYAASKKTGISMVQIKRSCKTIDKKRKVGDGYIFRYK